MNGGCQRRLSVSDTMIETIHLVTTRSINPLGTLHGGVALRWMITAGSMASMRVARSPTLIAHLDHVFFLNPVRLGKNAVITAWVELVGRTSMELTILLEEEDPITGERTLSTAAHMTYVAVDDRLKPKPVGACIEPANQQERMLQERALERRRHRRPRKDVYDIELPRPIVPGASRSTHRLVNPEDTLAYNAMHGGRLMHIMDELSGIVAISYARGPVVTAAVDATDFLTPILVGKILGVHAALTYTGRTSMEITVKAIVEDPDTGEKRKAASSYFTMVHLGPDWKPKPVPKPTLTEEWQLKLAEEARTRRERRRKMLEFFKQSITEIKPPRRDDIGPRQE